MNRASKIIFISLIFVISLMSFISFMQVDFLISTSCSDTSFIINKTINNVSITSDKKIQMYKNDTRSSDIIEIYSHTNPSISIIITISFICFVVSSILFVFLYFD